MTDMTDGMNVAVPAAESSKAEGETEAKLSSEIKSLWSAHQTSAATARQTKEELEDLRLDLGWKLSEMKSILVRTGRGGGWASYLRSHGVPRATGERYIKRFEVLSNRRTNRLTDTLSEPTDDDVRRFVRRLLPRLRKVLTTPTSVSLFVDEVGRQLQTSLSDLSVGTGQVEQGDSSGPGVTRVPQVV
jgi:hypothetical protein